MKKAIGVDFFGEVLMPSWLQEHEGTLYFVGTKANVEKNNYEKNLYQLKDGQVRQLTRSNDVGSYHTGKEGLRFLKPVKRDDKWDRQTAIYELPYDGGEAMEVLRLPYAFNSVEWLNEKDFFFVASENLKINRYVASGLSISEASKKMEKEDEQCREFVEVPFWTNGGGDISELRSVLYLYQNGEVKKISGDDGHARIACLSSDKKIVYYTKTMIHQGLEDNFNNLYSYDTKNGQTKKHELFEKNIYYRSLNCIDENEALLGVGLCEKYGDNENTQLYGWNLKTNQMMKINDGDLYSLGNSVGSDIKMGNRFSQPVFVDDGFYLTVTDEDHAPLMKFGYDGSVVAVTKGLEMVQEFISCKDGFYIIAMVEDHAGEIYHLGYDGTLIRLTSLNTALEEIYQYHPLETITFINENGIEIKGWVMLPSEINGKCPAILDIHGGPKTVYGPHFFHEMQWFCANGYAVIFTNPTGSDGKGNKFSDIRGCYGSVDYRDLMTFVDVVLEKYPCIDENRLGVTGGSYGGFMTNWMIGHTNRFKAAVSQRSIASWLIFENTSDIGYTFGADQMQGDQWHQLELLWNQSPIQFAPQVTTPTLFIHSDEDTRCWMAEGISMFTALKRHGVDSKLCLFRGENHELSRSGKPQNRIRRLEELLGWMNHYLK